MSGILEIDNVALEMTMDNLAALQAEAPRWFHRKLRQEAEQILTLSKKEVPWDTTHLLQTGTVEAGDLEILIGYNTPYAAYQHENMYLNHPKPGTKAKYLEDPFFERVHGMGDRITAKWDREIVPGEVRAGMALLFQDVVE